MIDSHARLLLHIRVRFQISRFIQGKSGKVGAGESEKGEGGGQVTSRKRVRSGGWWAN